MSDLVKCSSCSRLPQPKEKFLGKGNIILKTCEKCREKSTRNSSTPLAKEVRDRWNEENKEIMRPKRLALAHKWIAKQKAADEVGYNSRIQAVRKKSATTKLRSIKSNAIKRNIEWELDDEEAIILIKSECIYCGYRDNSTNLNGIDRLDSSKNYQKNNCVSCCTHCNIMKGCYDPDTFIERCRKIGQCQQSFPEITKCDIARTLNRKPKEFNETASSSREPSDFSPLGAASA